jgi:hypothetical protein
MSKPIPAGKLVEGDMTTALDSRFLNAMLLKAACEKKKTDHIVLTIDRVEFHEALKYENGTTDKNAYLIYFEKSDKPLKLSKTNIKRIIGLHGAIGANWKGKKIAVGIEQDRRPDLGGIKGDCVRVKSINPETGKAPEAF